jgi:hypothetical protein
LALDYLTRHSRRSSPRGGARARCLTGGAPETRPFFEAGAAAHSARRRTPRVAERAGDDPACSRPINHAPDLCRVALSAGGERRADAGASRTRPGGATGSSAQPRRHADLGPGRSCSSDPRTCPDEIVATATRHHGTCTSRNAAERFLLNDFEGEPGRPGALAQELPLRDVAGMIRLRLPHGGGARLARPVRRRCCA